MAAPNVEISSDSKNYDNFVYVYDRREKNAPAAKVSLVEIDNFAQFKSRLHQSLGLTAASKYVIVTTNREEVKDNETWEYVDKGDTLYLLHAIDQELIASTQQKVNYLPHYDTIVKGGMYEYYASEGQNPLSYAFAELIDNSLAATRNNDGPRNIEIRLHFEDSTIYIIDNGKGMTPRQLNNWAIYRLSKFIRKDKRSKVNLDETVEEEESFVDRSLPKSLNSDISYFGVGGKQAVFFIGTSTRMITRPIGSQDVHELTISKDEFEKKERNNEEIYSGFIRNRKVGDASHIDKDDTILKNLIEVEEETREHFTVVVIQGISKEHLLYLKDKMKDWTRQLAHIYHYYLHGPNGNIDTTDDDGVSKVKEHTAFSNIDIKVLYRLSKTQQTPNVINLRDIEDDMQTQYVRGSVSSFEFRAVIDGIRIEGVLRYHPFMYDRETYPLDIHDRNVTSFEDEHDYAISEVPARGRRPIFECFWNGRLIPYTQIDSFEWCNPPKKARGAPVECYNRVSGVLWTDDNFQVSTNKLTYIDLELKLRDKLAAFTRVINGQEKRTAIEKEFSNWLKECHNLHDKQIHFTQFQGQIVRTDLPKQRQTPWASYHQVDWDGKIYKAGQMVRILRTVPTLLGTISRILLYGDYTDDVYATGGDLEIIQEPKCLYNETKIVPLSKLDRGAGVGLIRKYIEEEEAKLPNELEISWPEGNEVTKNQKRRIGEMIGDIKVEILNKKGEKISKLPGKDNASKKLLVELKVIWHASTGPVTIISHISQHGKSWPYWFRKMDNIKNIGQYTLQLQAVITESGENVFAGKQLPSEKIPFQVTEGEAVSFIVGLLEGPFRIGVPFNIPLELKDEFGNPTRASSQDFHPKLEASGLEISHGNVTSSNKSTSIIIKEVIAKGLVSGTSGKNFQFTISIPELKYGNQISMKIRLVAGPPAELSVTPEDTLSIVNGVVPTYIVQLKDIAGNNTVLEGRQSVVCKLTGAASLPSYSIECSNTGCGTIRGSPVILKKMKGSTTLTAKFDVQGTKLKTVERKIKVLPSGKPCELRVYYPDSDTIKQITNNTEIVKVAGETLQGLTYALYDEAEREVELTDKLISKIKLNWVAKPPKDLLIKGQLPGVKALNCISEVKYCQVTIYEGTNIELGFVIRSKTGEASTLHCTCTESNQILCKQSLSGDIHIVVRDKFGNDIVHESNSILKDLSYTAEGWSTSKFKVSLCEDMTTIKISNVTDTSGLLGNREIQISYNNLKGYIRLEVVPGAPTQLKFVNYDVDEEVLVYNEGKFPKPLSVQLLDKGGNVVRKSDIRMQLARDMKLKLLPSAQPTKTNKDGIADFGNFTVSAPRGVYELQPKAFVMSSTVIPGPKLKVSIQPDPTRACSLNVSYDTKATYVAGDKMTDFMVKIFSEDGGLLENAKSSHISLKFWKSDDKDATNLPSRTLSYNPTNEKKANSGEFNFKNISLPEQSGAYNIMFVYYDGKHQLFSNVDKYGNHVTKGMNGSVLLEIESKIPDKELPVFNGKQKNTTLTLAGGTCTIQNLMIQENSPGVDGCEYRLLCTVDCNAIPKTQNIKPYIIPFLFYDDVKKQLEMSTLSKERDSLQTTIKTYKSLFETTEQLIEELKISVKEAKVEETRIREEIKKRKYAPNVLNSAESIEKVIKGLNEKKDTELNKKRRICSLPTIMADDPEVLGKIGHLAQIKDNDAARVLSWHMSSDMDCVVTMTTKKAKEIYNQTSGRQQVLPLASIYKKSLTEWHKPLPHVKYKPTWKPTGNLMFARNLLVFPQNEDKCKTVFSMLLGDTLWIDTLDQANEYREELVKFTNCPTILTREGDRIRSNGKFGGLMNKAPPVEKLRGAVFGAPVSEVFNQLCSDIENLQNLKSSIIAHQTAASELKDQMDTIKSPEMQAKYEECREVEVRLHSLEEKLGVTKSSKGSITPFKRTLDRDVADEPNSKKVKPSTTLSEVNGNHTSITPTRQSRRIAAMTPTTDSEGRKKLKRS
ncbi:inactivation of X chromosome by DNA methylation [Mactra antiquata]